MSVTYRFRNGCVLIDLGDGRRIRTHVLPDGAALAVAYRVPGGSAAAFEGATLEAVVAKARGHLAAGVAEQSCRVAG